MWIVIHAINTFPGFQITYPSSFIEQEKNAKGFKSASTVGFDNCAGAIDGILIWMLKPTAKEAAKAGDGQKKFLFGRKNKFGLNCQAVSNVRGKILDISITYGGSSSDLLAYKASDLCKRVEEGVLRPGLVLYGNNAYLNLKYMAMPYPNVANNPLEKSKDNYNFFHSQVCLILHVSIFRQMFEQFSRGFSFFSSAFKLSVVLAFWFSSGLFCALQCHVDFQSRK